MNKGVGYLPPSFYFLNVSSTKMKSDHVLLSILGPKDFFFIFCFHIKPAQPVCGPFKEGVSTTLTCGIDCASDKLPIWTAEIDTVTSTVAGCQGNVCAVLPGYSTYFSISPTGSPLTINRVSRYDPFNMETTWTCQCGGPQNTNTVCGKLQVYGQLNYFFFISMFAEIKEIHLHISN